MINFLKLKYFTICLKKFLTKKGFNCPSCNINDSLTVDKKYATGSKHTGIVRNFTNYGIFVELEEGVDGLIHISDLSWTKKIKHPSEFSDLDSDSYPEIIFGTDNGEMHALHLDGTSYNHMPIEFPFSYYSSPVIYDIEYE